MRQYPPDGERFLVVISNPDDVATEPFTGTDIAADQNCQQESGMVPQDLIDNYSWVKELRDGWDVTVIAGRSSAEVIRIFGGDPDAPLGEVAFADLDEQRTARTDDLEPFVQVLHYGEHIVTLEQYGWSGSLPEIARRCSAGGGHLFSVCWNVHAAGMVAEAIDGTVTAHFESLYPYADDEGPWDRRPAWAIGPENDVSLSWQICMAQLEQQTGVEIDPAWLRTPLPTFRVPEPHWLYQDVPGADRA